MRRRKRSYKFYSVRYYIIVQKLHFQIDEVQILHYYIFGGAKMSELKNLRIEKKMTQKEVAELVGISLRSYKSYENDGEKRGTIKYNYIMEQVNKVNFIDEDHGVLTVEDITNKCARILEKYGVKFCYLFGSYAKGKETPASDVDLLISADVKGLQFYGMVEELRGVLRKRVDVLDINQLKNNLELTEEIFKDGLKIYG